MQRLLRQRRTKRYTFSRIVKAQGQPTTHQRHGADPIPQSRDVQERRDIAYAVSRAFHELRRCSVKCQLSSRNLARAELIFKAVNLNVTQATMLISRLERRQRKRATTGRSAVGTRERQRHLRRNRRREPLATVESIPSRILLRDRFRDSNVRATREFSHPLTGSPKLIRIARDQMRHRAINQSLIA